MSCLNFSRKILYYHPTRTIDVCDKSPQFIFWLQGLFFTDTQSQKRFDIVAVLVHAFLWPHIQPEVERFTLHTLKRWKDWPFELLIRNTISFNQPNFDDRRDFSEVKNGLKPVGSKNGSTLGSVLSMPCFVIEKIDTIYSYIYLWTRRRINKRGKLLLQASERL